MTENTESDKNETPVADENTTPDAPPTGGTPWVIKQVDFEKSGAQRKHFPKEPKLPEVAFVGKSNVGKSSLLNVLVNRKRLAKVSRTPGRTQLVNFFLVNGDTRLVDLPGYGFAKAPREVKETWDKMITNYLLGNRQLRLVVTLFDVRREPNEEDINLLNWLKHYDFPILAVITKSDKLTRSAQMQARQKLSNWLEQWNPRGIVLFSALNRSGRDELLLEVGTILAEPPREWNPQRDAAVEDESDDESDQEVSE